MKRAPWFVVAAALVVLPLLPLPEWTGAGDSGPDTWNTMLRLWGLGLLVVGGVAVVASRIGPRLHLPSLTARVDAERAVVALAVLLALASAFTARFAYSANPQLIDEAAQLFQARVFAQGRVAAPTPPSPVFFLTQLTTITRAGWVAQFPPGGSVVLALGLLIGVPWIVNPVLGGLGVWLVYRVARGLYGPRTAVYAAVAWACSAWVLFMSASYMNHVAATTLALAAWALIFAPRYTRTGHAALAGLALAACAATRPLDAVAAALPIGWWILRERRWRLVPWMALGGLPILAAWAWLNQTQWGSPLRLGYTALYGTEERLGFHMDPYGVLYTPMIAVSNAAMAVRRLYIYLYETPVPVLALVALWGVLARHRHRSDEIVLIGAVAAPVLYLFYWHSGFFLGPRFYYVAVPWLAIALAKAARWLWARTRRAPRALGLDWAIGAAGVVVLAWSLLGMVPDRFQTYRDSFPTFKRHPEDALASKGITRALVLVPESWGSRLVAELWARGAQPGLVERVYRHADACDLAEFVAAADSAGLHDVALNQGLERFIRERPPAPLVRDWPDHTLRLRPRPAMPPACRAELARDQAGFTVYGNLMWLDPIGLDRGIVFARDMFERDPELLRVYAGWPVFRYAPPPGQPDALPQLSQVQAGGAERP